MSKAAGCLSRLTTSGGGFVSKVEAARPPVQNDEQLGSAWAHSNKDSYSHTRVASLLAKEERHQ